jgi:ribosomal-protein-alanine N-acetyltransferase
VLDVARGNLTALTHPAPLRGDGFVLRPFTIDDVAPDHDAIEHPSSARWLNPVSTGEPEVVFRDLEKEREAGRMLTFAIADPSNGRYLGAIVLFVKEHETGELAYVVAPEARGRGLAWRSVVLLGNWAVAELGLQRLQLRISPENEASQKVARAAGYQPEGVLRSSTKIRGERRDMMMWSRLPEDG